MALVDSMIHREGALEGDKGVTRKREREDKDYPSGVKLDEAGKRIQLDKFGGSGIIPMDITNMNYDQYCEAHHHFMIER